LDVYLMLYSSQPVYNHLIMRFFIANSYFHARFYY